MNENLGSDWPVKAEPAPKLTKQQWYWISPLGAILLFMALLQLASFSGFAGTFEAEGLSPPKIWAALIIFAELWGAAGFFKMPLSRAFRAVSNFLAVAAVTFWVVEAFRIFNQRSYVDVLVNNSYRRPGLGLFGGHLYQAPSVWTIAETVGLFYLVIYALQVLSLTVKVNSKVKSKRR